MKKVTYYMYSCDICCMIRERMKWMAEIMPSVKNQEKGHIRNYWKRKNENKTKLEIVVFSIFESKMGRTCNSLSF